MCVACSANAVVCAPVAERRRQAGTSSTKLGFNIRESLSQCVGLSRCWRRNEKRGVIFYRSVVGGLWLWLVDCGPSVVQTVCCDGIIGLCLSICTVSLDQRAYHAMNTWCAVHVASQRPCVFLLPLRTADGKIDDTN